MDVLSVDTLAEVLQEPKRSLLMKVLRTFGVDRTTAILADTLTCEANGGSSPKMGRGAGRLVASSSSSSGSRRRRRNAGASSHGWHPSSARDRHLPSPTPSRRPSPGTRGRRSSPPVRKEQPP